MIWSTFSVGTRIDPESGAARGGGLGLFSLAAGAAAGAAGATAAGAATGAGVGAATGAAGARRRHGFHRDLLLVDHEAADRDDVVGAALAVQPDRQVAVGLFLTGDLAQVGQLLAQQRLVGRRYLDQAHLEVAAGRCGRGRGCRHGAGRRQARRRLAAGFLGQLLQDGANARQRFRIGFGAVAIGVELVLQHVLGFQKGVDDDPRRASSRRRVRSSRFSKMCVVSVRAVKPNVAAPPLIECAARKIALSASASGDSMSTSSSSCSISTSSSSASSKKVW
jgi:hypothetical protein